MEKQSEGMDIEKRSSLGLGNTEHRAEKINKTTHAAKKFKKLNPANKLKTYRGRYWPPLHFQLVYSPHRARHGCGVLPQLVLGQPTPVDFRQLAKVRAPRPHHHRKVSPGTNT